MEEVKIANVSLLNVTDQDVDNDDDDWDFATKFEFGVHGVLLFAVGCLGLLGNALSVVILSRPQMKSSINTMLVGLVCCDSVLVLTSLFMFSFTAFRFVRTSSLCWVGDESLQT